MLEMEQFIQDALDLFSTEQKGQKIYEELQSLKA